MLPMLCSVLNKWTHIVRCYYATRAHLNPEKNILSVSSVDLIFFSSSPLQELFYVPSLFLTLVISFALSCLAHGKEAIGKFLDVMINL